jgi:hypothetical protein
MQEHLQQARTFVVDLAISADEFLRLYQGSARAVIVRARNGQTVQFPANALTRFVLHDGVHGSFAWSSTRRTGWNRSTASAECAGDRTGRPVAASVIIASTTTEDSNVQ